MVIGKELLEGEAVRLAQLSDRDAEQIASWYGNVEFGRMFSSNAVMPRNAAKVVEQIAAWEKSPIQFMFAVRRLIGGMLVGFCGYDEVSWRNRAGWLAVALDPAHWGKGYGREAVRLVLDYGFEELGLHRAQLTVFSYNERAITLYESLGFKREGVFRQQVYRDGQYFDMILFGLLEEEWRQQVLSE